jgi:hypothetical protein
MKRTLTTNYSKSWKKIGKLNGPSNKCLLTSCLGAYFNLLPLLLFQHQQQQQYFAILLCIWLSNINFTFSAFQRALYGKGGEEKFIALNA